MIWNMFIQIIYFFERFIQNFKQLTLVQQHTCFRLSYLRCPLMSYNSGALNFIFSSSHSLFCQTSFVGECHDSVVRLHNICNMTKIHTTLHWLHVKLLQKSIQCKVSNAFIRENSNIVVLMLAILYSYNRDKDLRQVIPIHLTITEF